MWDESARVGEAMTAAANLSMATSFEILHEDDVWICDTGASSHSTKSRKGAINERSEGAVSLGFAGKPVQASSTIDVPGRFIRADGTLGICATLRDCAYSKSNNFNLLSLTRLLCNGWHIEKGNATGIEVTNASGDVISFDIIVPTARGAIFACRFTRDVELAMASTEAGTAMNINKAHCLLGHVDEESTRATAKSLGWVITRGTLKPCLYCARSKAKKKVTVKESEKEKVTKPGKLVHLDLSKISVPLSDGTQFEVQRKQWKIIVDAATGKKWSDFSKTKDAMVEPTCEWMHKMKTRGIPIEVVRLDPSGENHKLEKRAQSADWQVLQPVEFEFTSRDTPQHNSLAEVAFPFLAGRARAMMGAANVPDDSRGKLSLCSIRLATQLDGLKVIELNGEKKTRDEHVFGKNPSWAKHLRIFGEAGVVAEGKNGKTGDRGIDMMFVGYPSNRESDSVHMWNPKTNGIVTTRDVIWLKRMYFEKPAQVEVIDVTGEAIIDDDESNDGGQTNVKDEGDDASDNNDEDQESEAGEADDVVASHSHRYPIRSNAGVPPERLIDIMESFVDIQGMKGTAAELGYLQKLIELEPDELEVMLVGAGIADSDLDTDELKPMNYKQAMASKDRLEWKKEVANEKGRFDKYNVVTVVKRCDIPKDAKILTTTWAMKKKANGTFRGRLNARGFEQVDGSHFFGDSIAAPVTCPSTIRTLIVLLCMNPKWVARIKDVEGAFLQGKFENGEVIYIEVPDGMEEFYGSRSENVLLLNVPIYGTKQAAHCFYKTLVKRTSERGYQRSKADPCLHFVWHNDKLGLMVSWVDDLLVLGEEESVQMIEDDLDKSFTCKSEGELKEYVGNKIEITRDSNGLGRAKITQPVLIQKLEQEFYDGGPTPRTPAAPGTVLLKNDGSESLVGSDATRYRSGTALAMYTMQWSRCEYMNGARDLARMMSSPTQKHWKALMHLVRYAVGTKNRGLVLAPTRIWNGNKDFKFRIGGRSDSDYAANTDDRKSVSGGRVFLEMAPVQMRSNTQRFVTLSVTESESGAGVMVAQDMMYSYRLLTSLGLQVELPMILEMDNKGAVDLANNYSVGGRTRHVDVRFFYLRELKDEGLLVIRHVPGTDNDADIFTKNVTGDIFEKHIPLYVGHDDEYLKKPEDR